MADCRPCLPHLPTGDLWEVLCLPPRQLAGSGCGGKQEAARPGFGFRTPPPRPKSEPAVSATLCTHTPCPQCCSSCQGYLLLMGTRGCEQGQCHEAPWAKLSTQHSPQSLPLLPSHTGHVREHHTRTLLRPATALLCHSYSHLVMVLWHLCQEGEAAPPGHCWLPGQ